MTTATTLRPAPADTGATCSRVRTCIVLEKDVEEAARFWTDIVPGSRIEAVQVHPGGNTRIVTFSLSGAPYMLFNAPFGAEQSMASSISVLTFDQAETDRIWDALLEGGSPLMCGWLRDRYGVHWQVTPSALVDLLALPDAAAAARVLAAMMTMVKIDIAALEAAARGD
jgi:predicted 3-demethylubiquinone-9 3-methyltransferase (glyoxalase superfamily)